MNEIVKLIKNNNKKISTRKRNDPLNPYPYIASYNSLVVGWVYHGHKIYPQYKRVKVGPEKYILNIYNKGMSIKITDKRIKVFNITPVSSTLLFDDELIYESQNITKDDYFNISMVIPNMLTPNEILEIRKQMLRKENRYNRISIYLTPEWC